MLETALNSGITYFDTARMYGAGLAEGVLGDVVARNRSRIILASKAGILPESRSIAIRALGRGTRLVHKVIPALKSHLPAPASSVPRPGIFEPPEIRKSVETSLRELRTDYLDILLLHECSPENIDDRLLELLSSLITEGKIRAFGIATDIDSTVTLLERSPSLSNVVQIPSNIWNLNVPKLSGKPHDLLITHSSITSRIKELMYKLAASRSLLEKWKAATGVDPHSERSVAQLLLAHAVSSNPGGIVLFFSSIASNIIANVGAIKGDLVSRSQIDGLNAFLSTNSLVE